MLLGIFLNQGCTSEDEPTISAKPVCTAIEPIASDVDIVVTGHGVLITDKGKTVEPNREEILANQHRLILKWSKALGDPVPTYCYKNDPVLENFHHIKALLKRAAEEEVGVYISDNFINQVMDSQYQRRILKLNPSKESSNIISALSTTNIGSDYIEECLANDVPVPDVVLDSQWINHGTLTDDFIGGGVCSDCHGGGKPIYCPSQRSCIPIIISSDFDQFRCLARTNSSP